MSQFIRLMAVIATFEAVVGLGPAAHAQEGAARSLRVEHRTCLDRVITFGGTLCNPGRARVLDDSHGPMPFKLEASATSLEVQCKQGRCPAGLSASQPLKFRGYTYNGQFAPPIWFVQRDRDDHGPDIGTLRFTLRNRLPPTELDGIIGDQPTNIHTHGLMVSPGKTAAAGQTKYGDNVFVLICPPGASKAVRRDPGGHGHTATEICTAAHPSSPMLGHEIVHDSADYAIRIPGDHPAGLDWFHPHAHTLSSLQVSSGLSGLIAIGDLCSYPTLDPAIRERICETRGNASALRPDVPERFMMLKDLQITSGALPGPDHLAATAEGYTVGRACRDGVESSGDGWCITEPSPPDPGAPGRGATLNDLWLFSVNGQVSPEIRMAAGRPEVWRIANVSANVTYRLALCSSRPEHDAGRTGTSTVPLTVCSRIPFQIINLDGARPWSLRQDQQGSVIVPDETEMVLMPGSRAEIVVTMPEPGKAYFAQMGFNMPDVWPATVLARLTVSRPVNAVPPLRLAFTRSDGVRATTTSPPMMAVPSYPEPECSGNCVLFRESGTVNAVLGKTVTPDGAEVLSIKVTRHDLEADPDFRDCLREREAADGSPNPKCHAFVGQPFDAARRDLVVKHRSTVAFRIYNATSEIHNFHVHQSKFNVTDVGPAPSAADSRPAAAAIRRSVSQRAASGPGGRVDIVDSVPVMSTTIETKDGADVFKDVTTITVEFTRPEQIGEFVFHCHILEHEDKGMMNTLTVYN